MEQLYSVCAVIVTYNRKELLLRNITSLLNQTYIMDILIFDNASTDGTYDYLCNNNIINNDRIMYTRANHNGGGSFGFCHGEQEAYIKGYDYLWLMDDDGYCLRNDTLEKLINCINEKKAIYNSLVVGNIDSLELTFSLGPYNNWNEVVSNAKNDLIIGYGNPYNGTLVPKECFSDVGFTDERFFIYGDENDFYYRTKNAGYEWITCVQSLYFHPINRNIIREFRFGDQYFDVKDQPIWKFYLEMRNATYIRKKYFNKKLSAKYYAKIILISILSKDKKFKRIKWGWIAVNDGEKQYFERPIPFKE